MKKKAGKDTKRVRTPKERPVRGEAWSAHGHTGEGAASALAHLLSEHERQRRESVNTEDTPGDEHP